MAFCPRCSTPRPTGGRFCASCGLDLSNVQTWGIGQPPAVGPTATAQDVSLSAVVVLVGGGMYSIGSALPWISVTAPFVGTVTKSGLEGGDGIATLILGLLMALLGIARLTGNRGAGSKVAMVILCVMAFALAIFEAVNIGDRIANLDSAYRSLATVGIGLWLMIVGGGIASVGSLSLRGPR